MIRVAVITGKMDSGGKKNLIMEYYRNIDRNQIQFDFICDADSQAIPAEEIKLMGGNIYLISPYQHIGRNIRDIYRICKKNNYYIIHAYNSTMNIFPLFAGALAGVPVRISESLTMAHSREFKTVLKKMLRPFSKCFVTHYVACGKDCGRWQFGDNLFKEEKVAIFKTVINTEKNAYNPILREKTRREYNLNDKLVIGHIGRFVAQKNPLFIIDIFKEIYMLEEKSVLLLIGDGELKESILDKISALDLKDHVIYLGRREDISQFYNAMDAFLLPSLYEGLPVVGLESQSCGLPIFFSTEITPEAAACKLSHFISLDMPASEWARIILDITKDNIPSRRSWAKEIALAGFDSAAEGYRIQRYYLDAIKNME